MDNEQENTLIVLHISGNELEKNEGYNLRYILDSLKDFESLIDKTYLHFENKSRLSDEDKENLSLRLVDVREGSFIADLAIQMKAIVIPMAPLVAENSDFIWKMVKTSYTYLKTVLGAKKEGKTVNVQIDNSTDSILIVNNGTGNVDLTINPVISELSPKLSPIFSNLAKKVDGENVEKISFGESENSNDMVFTTEDAKLFKKRQYLEETVINLQGKIVNSSYSSFSGQIEIFENENDVPQGMYRFTTSQNLHREDQWKNMYLVIKSFTCQRRVTIDPSKGLEESVSEIHLIGIDN